jgi:hypothetical protein
MSKIAASKWLISTGVAFLLPFAIEIRAKDYAADAAMSMARRTAGKPILADPQSLANKSGITTTLGLAVACIAVSCWAVSVYRREPGSSLVAIIPAIVYVMFLLVLV